MLVNMFKMREDVQAYSLGGMGCGNGVIGIQLVRDMLQAHPGANALFITAEICSSGFYQGRDTHCLVSLLVCGRYARNIMYRALFQGILSGLLP